MSKNKSDIYINRINNLLDERFKEYPERGIAFYKLSELINEFSDYFCIKNSNVSNKRLNDSYKKIFNSPVFICGNMKSGTTLLTELLDGHEDLMVLPGDTHYVNKFIDKQLTNKELLRYWLQRVINPTGKKPFWYIDSKKIEVFSKEVLENNIDESFHAVLTSILKINYTEKLPKYWIEKTPRNEYNVERLLKKYPKAKFINIIRDPLSNIASLKKLYDLRKKEFNILTFSKDNSKLLYQCMINQNKYKNNYYVLKYEELLINPKKEILGICDFLSINFCESLLMPTVNRMPTSANSMYKEDRVVGKINSEKNNKKWIKDLSLVEKLIVIILNYDAAINWGYLQWNNIQIKKFYYFYNMRITKFILNRKRIVQRLLRFISLQIKKINE